MKRDILTIIILFMCTLATVAQDTENRKKRLSPEEFRAKQKEYITQKAELTQQEADAFFPLYFELQKKKFELEHSVRKSIKLKCKEMPTDEQCLDYVNKMAELKVEIAKLEQEYTQKYLQVIGARKILAMQHAEMTFQRDLMKKMMNQRGAPRHGDKKPAAK